MPDSSDNRQWNGKTGGFKWQQKALVAIMRYADIRLFYSVMALVIPFYMLFAHKGYLAAYRFFRQRINLGRVKSFFMVYKNHFRFGQVVLDRFAAFSGVKYNIEIIGEDLLKQYSGQQKGILMIGSHVGNYEMAGYLLQLESKRINAVIFAGESETMMENRAKILERHNTRLIPIKADMSHLFKINEALEAGEVVSMHADRLFGNTKSTACEFFGQKAKFPTAAFTLAKRRKVPVLGLFVMKAKAYKYNIYIKEICNGTDDCNIEKSANLFACELEDIVRQYPEQWFNYYDFWQQ